jgi:hypothetical protein
MLLYHHRQKWIFTISELLIGIGTIKQAAYNKGYL